MARRVSEAETLANAGITQSLMGPVKSVEVVKEIKLHPTAGGVFSVQLNYTGELLAIGFGTGGIQIYETKTGKMVNELRACRQGGFAIMTLHFHPKEPHLLYAASAEGHIHVFNVNTYQEVETITESGNEISTMDFSVDGYNFVTGGRDLNVRVYDAKSNKMVKKWGGLSRVNTAQEKVTIGNTMRVFAIKFHPNNQYIFISGGWDNYLKIWDIRDNDGIKRNIRGPHICGDSIDIRENEILSGQWTAKHALQEYSYSMGTVVREIKFPHTDGAFLYTAQYCSNDCVIAGGSGTNSAEVIEISTDKHIGGYKMNHPVHAVDTANQGRVMAVGGAAPVFALLRLQD